MKVNLFPFAPYKNRVIEKSNLRVEQANEVNYCRQTSFWKGTGVKITPVLDKKNTLRDLKINKWWLRLLLLSRYPYYRCG